jgi:hypothetical protein
MRKLALVGCFALATAGMAQVKLQIVRDGKGAGVVTVSQKMRPDGSKQVMMSMETAGLKFRSESIYSANGLPQRKFQEISVPEQKTRRTIIAEFSEKSVHVTLDNNGTRTVKDFALPPNASSADKSEFWFVRDKPTPGAKSTAHSFNLEKLAWESVTTTFIGPVEITINGVKLKANKTQSERGIAYVDDQGLPIKLELPNGAMERIVS